MNKTVQAFVLLFSLQACALFAEDPPVQSAGSVEYIAMKPSFVVSIGNKSYLKADISLRARGEAAVNQITHHMPMLRDGLVLLFSRQQFADMDGSAGRETLRQEALQTLQSLLNEETGVDQVEDLLFTSFVLQR